MTFTVCYLLNDALTFVVTSTKEKTHISSLSVTYFEVGSILVEIESTILSNLGCGKVISRWLGLLVLFLR